jgi:hypothetical protein
MDLTIGSLNFRVGSLGTICLSDPIGSGPSAGKTASAMISESSIGSSSEVNSPVNFKPTESIDDTIEELNEIMENLDLGEPAGDFMICCNNTSEKSTYTWKTGWNFMRMTKQSSQVPAAKSITSTKCLLS